MNRIFVFMGMLTMSALGDFLSITGYVKCVSNRTPDECMAALREKQGRSAWLGGYYTRIARPKARSEQKDMPFEIEYYRLHSKSGRPTHVVQRLRGVFYQKDGQTHVAAKVHFTSSGLMWLWLAVALTVVSVALLLYTRNVVMFLLIGMTGSFLLAMALVLWLDRHHLVRMVRRSMVE